MESPSLTHRAPLCPAGAVDAALSGIAFGGERCMGQQDVCELLESRPRKWFTSREISRAIGVAQGPVAVSLKRLRDNNEVVFCIIRRRTGRGREYNYRHKP